MNTPFRDRFHAARKAMIHRLEHFWPALPLVAVSRDVPPGLVARTAPRLDPPAAMPDQARSWLEQHGGRQEVQGVLRLTRPVTVDPKMGLLFSEKRIIWGTSDTPERERGPRFAGHLAAPSRRLPGAILLHHVHGDNFFHFFFFVLSKASVADAAGLDPALPFLVGEKTAATGFFKEALEMGVFGSRPVLVQGRKEVIAVDEAFLVRDFFLTDAIMSAIAERFAAPVGGQGDPLLIERKASANNGRRFRNQDAVTALARSKGFRPVDPGSLPLREQVQLFAGAPAVAGAHGAGLTNLLFRRGPCRVLELFSPGMGSPHYFMLAREKGFSYESQMTLAPQGRAFTADTEVDLDALDAGLERLLG
ncbi:glycosyltransferase family 61 protein [Pannonibacter carbonis]|uniref:glycosyltransferase family 61 protein n=1 Tax=Pannonibacter carbonis TaxID=2067569 RepID=UPI001AD947F7|nr:glycosyltransferase family 61 protein [Pannonibacter carbonis]